MVVYVLHVAERIDACQYVGVAKIIQTISACCSPVSGEALSERDAAATAAVFKLLADPTRLRLLSLVAASEGGECCVCDLPDALGVSQPTVSHHLKALHEGGLLAREQRGRWAWYRVEREALHQLGAVLS